MACAVLILALCCTLILPAQADWDSESREEVSRRREEQELLACQLRSNDTLSEEFFSSVNTNPDEAAASGVESATCYYNIIIA